MPIGFFFLTLPRFSFLWCIQNFSSPDDVLYNTLTLVLSFPFLLSVQSAQLARHKMLRNMTWRLGSTVSPSGPYLYHRKMHFSPASLYLSNYTQCWINCTYLNTNYVIYVFICVILCLWRAIFRSGPFQFMCCSVPAIRLLRLVPSLRIALPEASFSLSTDIVFCVPFSSTTTVSGVTDMTLMASRFSTVISL